MNESRFGWLVSWPRSGNTWMRFLIDSLLSGGAPIDFGAARLRVQVANRAEFDEHFGIESSELTAAEIEAARPALHRSIAASFRDGPLLLRKVHERCRRTASGERVFPPEISRGAVYIARDPRDVAVSWADFRGVTVDEAIRLMGDPLTTLADSRMESSMGLPQPLGTWSEHAVSWLEDSEMPVLLVKYEDLLAAAGAELARVAGFLGLAPDAAPLAADAAAFGKLREQEDIHGFPARSPSCPRFFRKGKAGEWRDVLSAAQVAKLKRDHGSVMARFGYL